MRVRDALDGDGSAGRGFYVEDAGYPVFADWLVESTKLPGRSAGRSVRRQPAARAACGDRQDRHLGRRQRAHRPGRLSDGSLPLLGMGRDVPDGVMHLRQGPPRGRLDHDELGRVLRAGARDHARHRRRPRRDVPGQPAVVDEAGRHGPPARRGARWAATSPKACATRTARCSASPASTSLDGSADAGAGRREPVADDRRRRRPGLRPHAASAPAARGGPRRDHAARAGPASCRQRRRPRPCEHLSFTEEMKGFVALDVDDPARRARPWAASSAPA